MTIFSLLVSLQDSISYKSRLSSVGKTSGNIAGSHTQVLSSYLVSIKKLLWEIRKFPGDNKKAVRQPLQQPVLAPVPGLEQRHLHQWSNTHSTQSSPDRAGLNKSF